MAPPRYLFFVIALCFLLLLLIYLSYQYVESSPYKISAGLAKQRIHDKQVDLVLDVRTDLERSTLGFLTGSVHIQSADLEKRMPTEYPDKNIRIIAYCNTGHRARMAAEKLHQLGYKNALYIATSHRTLQ
jgi:rhodanese-related sulfurtransferase